jgi:hypothetical protein
MITRCLRYTVSGQAKALSIHLGSTPATVKLKGIDGGPHKRRNMWFNSMIREEPYPGLKLHRIYGNILFRNSNVRCCMVVVSSCREVSA